MTDDIRKAGDTPDTGHSTDLHDRLSNVLDTYGANSQHWPEDDKNDLLAFIASDVKARRAMDEAQALDTMLNTAPDFKNTDKLGASILAAVQSQKVTPVENNVSVLPVARRSSQNRRWFDMGGLPSSALLAASLMIGVFVGKTEFISSLYPYESNVDFVTLTVDGEPDDEFTPEEIL